MTKSQAWIIIGLLIVVIILLYLVNGSVRIANIHLNSIELEVVHVQDAIYPLYNKP